MKYFAIKIINILVTSALLLLGLFALTHRRITRKVFGGIIIIVIAIRLMHFVFGENLLMGWDIFLSLVTVVAFVTFILRYVFKEGAVTWQRVEGAITAYMLIISAFSLSFLLTFFLIPGAFKFSDKAPKLGDPRLAYNFYYYRIMIITSLGYGDIIAAHPVAQTLAAMEALVGQLYPAVLIARLVSLYVVHGQRSDK